MRTKLNIIYSNNTYIQHSERKKNQEWEILSFIIFFLLIHGWAIWLSMVYFHWPGLHFIVQTMSIRPSILTIAHKWISRNDKSCPEIPWALRPHHYLELIPWLLIHPISHKTMQPGEFSARFTRFCDLNWLLNDWRIQRALPWLDDTHDRWYNATYNNC